LVAEWVNTTLQYDQFGAAEMASGKLGLFAAVVYALAGLGQQAALAAGQPCTNPDPLGVSRVQEIDSTGNPFYGTNGGAGNSVKFLADHEVVLTFDDGPFPDTTPAILSALADQCTKATFFYVGLMALAHPEILAQVDAAGQTVGAHTWSHANLRRLAGPLAQAEIERGVSMLQARLGHPIAPFFRFPYLSTPASDVKYLGGRDFAVFSIDIDSWDSHGLMPTPRIINYVMSRLKVAGRGIILMHDIKHTTAAAVPEILKQLKAGGYKIVQLVPKAPATTLAAYDDWAKQMIAKHDSGQAVAVDNGLPLGKAAKVKVRAPGQKHVKGSKNLADDAGLLSTSASLVAADALAAPGSAATAALTTASTYEMVFTFGPRASAGAADAGGIQQLPGMGGASPWPRFGLAAADGWFADASSVQPAAPLPGPRVARATLSATSGAADRLGHGDSLQLAYVILHQLPADQPMQRLTALEILSQVKGEEGVLPVSVLDKRTASAAKVVKGSPVWLTVGGGLSSLFGGTPDNKK
jgi:peptidoglycan/xylan/chitin deacetylase (PgdA/CDA1 family)